jgi:SAM-dependent methyltransferase
MPFKHQNDISLQVFAFPWDAGHLTFPKGAHILEIGAADADWRTPMLAERPDLTFTAIDGRGMQGPGTLIDGDVLKHDFPDASFDAVVLISSLEHIGLAQYGDSSRDDGDTIALVRSHRWLKPGGWLYFDVPYGPDYANCGNYRRYDDATLQSRLLRDQFVEHGRWIQTMPHPDSPYVAIWAQKC